MLADVKQTKGEAAQTRGDIGVMQGQYDEV